MSVVNTLIGNVKGPKGDTGATGATGATGSAATISVGSVTTTAYGNPAQVTNSGTTEDAVFDFVIPQGRPGQATTTMGGLTLDSITTSTASFPSPQVNDTGATAFGKIVKFFSDTVTALTGKLDTSKVANNLTTTESGYALDARQGKTLNDSLTPVDIASSCTFSGNVNPTANKTGVYVIGNMVVFNIRFETTGALSAYDNIIALPSRLTNHRYATSILRDTTAGNSMQVYANQNENIQIGASIPSGHVCAFSMVMILY